MSLLFFYKIGEQEGGTGPARGVSTSGREEAVEKESRRVNIVQILGTHACKWRNDTCSNCTRNAEGIKENGGGSQFKYDIFDTL
jgi:hypothetical protein